MKTCPKCGREPGQDQDGWFCPGCTAHPDDCTCAPLLQPGESWKPLDLAPALDGGCIDEGPVLLSREDGARLLYNGKVHTIAGESESLKTWLVLLGCVTVINEGLHALFIDYEDAADGIVRRLVALGCARDAILAFFHYVRPDEPYGPAARAVLAAAVTTPMAIVVIDGVTEAMSAHGLDPLSNADVATFNAKLPRPWAATGSIVVMIDHVTKAREGRGRYAIGAQHKLSAVDGAAYIVELLRPFGHGQHGVAKIIVAKDRPGRVREHCHNGVAGILNLRSEEDGSVMASIDKPREFGGQESAEFRPTVLMERISRFCEDNQGLTKNALIIGVKGKTDHKKLALELLVRDGYILAERNGNSFSHKSDRPFRQPGKTQASDQLTPDPEPDPD